MKVSSRHPTLHACLQELLKRLQKKHGKYAEALTQKAAADAQAAAAVHTPNVMQTMILFQQAKKRVQAAQDRAKAAQDQAKATKKVALEAEKDNDAAQKDFQELQRVMEPKRARTNATTANDHEECDEQSLVDMDIADYRRETARIQKRRSVALGSREDVPGCLRSKLVVWKEEQFNVLPFQGIEQRKKRVAEWVVKALPLVKPGVWGCVQDRAQWSTEEDAHIRPGHHWLCEFGDAGNDTSCEKQFNLDHRKCEDYGGTRLYNKDSALVIKRWLNRVEEDASRLMFQEWTQDVDTSRPPVAMLINSSELCAAGFKLKEVIPPRSLEGMGPKRFVLSVDDDTELFRSRCE